MKTQELRIGNYVIYECTTHIVYELSNLVIYSWWVKDNKPVIEKIQKDVSGVLVLNPYFDIEDRYDPIPLTEEWLLKFGFTQNDLKTYYFKDGEYEIRVSLNAFSGGLDKDPSWFISIQTGHGSQPVTIVRKYVHTLQNLYFALTGDELTIK